MLILSFLVSLLGSCGLIYWSLRVTDGGAFQDRANERSLHLGVIPKTGGLALLPTTCVVTLLVWSLNPDLPTATGQIRFPTELIAAWMAPATLIYAACFFSDRAAREWSAGRRFAVFLVASLGMLAGLILFAQTSTTDNRLMHALQILWSPVSLGLAALVVFTTLAFTNFFNFMDGIDGLAGSMGALGFACLGLMSLHGQIQTALCCASPMTHASISISAACTGFLVWNWPKARVFMGDTGSTFLGFSATSLGWIGAATNLWHWSIPFLIFFTFWFDATFTLCRRVLRGEKFWQAHREHFYQRAVLSLATKDLHERHRKTLIPAIGMMTLCSLIALSQHYSWFGLHNNQPWPALAILGTVHAVVAFAVERRFRLFVQTPGNVN